MPARMAQTWRAACKLTLQRKASMSGSTRQLREAIDRFVDAYQETAAPFEWTKQVVYASAPKKRYFDLCK
jgi:hypothetical protein